MPGKLDFATSKQTGIYCKVRVETEYIIEDCIQSLGFIYLPSYITKTTSVPVQALEL